MWYLHGIYGGGQDLVAEQMEWEVEGCVRRG